MENKDTYVDRMMLNVDEQTWRVTPIAFQKRLRKAFREFLVRLPDEPFAQLYKDWNLYEFIFIDKNAAGKAIVFPNEINEDVIFCPKKILFMPPVRKKSKRSLIAVIAHEIAHTIEPDFFGWDQSEIYGSDPDAVDESESWANSKVIEWGFGKELAEFNGE